MAASDLDMLKDMGFDADKAAMGLEKGGNLQGAIDWLEKNQDKTIQELRPDDDNDNDPPTLKPGEEAKSLLCKDCGKKFRSQAQAEFHATKTEHMNFEESTEEIAPLTEEEKTAKLADLRQKAAERKAAQSEQDRINTRRNEEINRKNTKEVQDLKEELDKKEQIKAAQAKRREKDADVEAKRRIKQKIEDDKEARRQKAEREKAQRMGQPAVPEPTPTALPKPSPSAQAHTTARLRLQLPTGSSITKSLPAETTLFQVAQAIADEAGFEPASFTSNFPKRVFGDTEMGQTLKEAGLVPSAVLIVK